eukprot:3863377-Rhodomonas_salina.8
MERCRSGCDADFDQRAAERNGTGSCERVDDCRRRGREQDHSLPSQRACVRGSLVCGNRGLLLSQNTPQFVRACMPAGGVESDAWERQERWVKKSVLLERPADAKEIGVILSLQAGRVVVAGCKPDSPAARSGQIKSVSFPGVSRGLMFGFHAGV